MRCSAVLFFQIRFPPCCLCYARHRGSRLVDCAAQARLSVLFSVSFVYPRSQPEGKRREPRQTYRGCRVDILVIPEGWSRENAGSMPVCLEDALDFRPRPHFCSSFVVYLDVFLPLQPLPFFLFFFLSSSFSPLHLYLSAGLRTSIPFFLFFNLLSNIPILHLVD